MYPSTPKPRAQDWARLVGYGVGASWAVLFPIFTSSLYHGVISLIFLYAWSLCVGVGSVLGAIGSILRRDVKVELPGLYLTQVGMLLYMAAQFGFSGSDFKLRIAFLILLMWHSTLLWPRIVGLEEWRIRHKKALLALTAVGERPQKGQQ